MKLGVRHHNEPGFFYLGSHLDVGIDPRRCPPFREFSCEDWIARRDGRMSEQEYRGHIRQHAALRLKGTDPLPETTNPTWRSSELALADGHWRRNDYTLTTDAPGCCG